MDIRDQVVEQRIRDIIAVATWDIDAVTVEVEDGVAYVEGVIPSEATRRALLGAIRNIPELGRLISCLATEHVAVGVNQPTDRASCPPPIVMHYYSLS